MRQLSHVKHLPEVLLLAIAALWLGRPASAAATGINIVSTKLTAVANASEAADFYDANTFDFLNEIDYGQSTFLTGTVGTITASAISGPLDMAGGTIAVSAFELDDSAYADAMLAFILPTLLPNGDQELEQVNNFGAEVNGYAVTTAVQL
jgi:hypothetical protein